jgi:hypothetical protein
MAAATSSIAQSPTIRITTAAHVLAQIQAPRAVKEQLRHEGVKVSHLAASEISALARSYLIEHRTELMPPAFEQAQRWMLEGFFGKRAQRAFCANLSSLAQTQKA